MFTRLRKAILAYNSTVQSINLISFACHEFLANFWPQDQPRVPQEKILTSVYRSIKISNASCRYLLYNFLRHGLVKFYFQCFVCFLSGFKILNPRQLVQPSYILDMLILLYIKILEIRHSLPDMHQINTSWNTYAVTMVKHRLFSTIYLSHFF